MGAVNELANGLLTPTTRAEQFLVLVHGDVSSLHYTPSKSIAIFGVTQYILASFSFLEMQCGAICVICYILLLHTTNLKTVWSSISCADMMAQW